jgi:hypothetical protein
VARHALVLAHWQTTVAGWRRPALMIPEAVPGPPRYRGAPKKPIKMGVITSGGAL